MLRYTIHTIIPVLLLCISYTLHAQNDNAPGIRILQYNLDQADLRINDIETDEQNRVLVATDKMLFIIDLKNQKPEKYLTGSNVKSVISDRDGNIFAAGDGKLFIVNKNQVIDLPNKNTIITDLAYINKAIWIATENGVYAYTLRNQRWKTYNTSNSKLKSNKIHSIRKDDNDILWISTEKGYIRIKKDKWELQDKKENIVKTRSNKEGQWMISSDDMWLIDPYNRKYPVGLDNDFYQGTINDFIIDSKGRVYIASDILVRFDPYNEIIEKYGKDVGLLTKKCLALACDLNDNIWIGTVDAGLFRIVFDEAAFSELIATPILEKPISCYGKSDAKIKVNVSSGIPPYTYVWSNPNISGDNPENIGAGEYSVTITDVEGQEYPTSINIVAPDPIQITLNDEKRVTNDNPKSGALTITTSGGTGALSIEWSNKKTSTQIKELSTGYYSVTVTDQNGCTAQETYQVHREKYIPELDVATVKVGQKLRINNLNFSADSIHIESQHFDILDEVYDFMNANDNVYIEIGGHTNTIPSHEYCDKLSTERARSVQDYIVKKGINPSRITYKGYGKRHPLVEGISLANRSKNQRVEITILQL